MRKGVTVVPISAPIIVATARFRGITPDDVNAQIMESKAPLLCSIAVLIHPANTALVVSLIIRTIVSASATPTTFALFFTRTIAEMKKYIDKIDPIAFLYFELNMPLKQ
jgi:hypothetical protein